MEISNRFDEKLLEALSQGNLRDLEGVLGVLQQESQSIVRAYCPGATSIKVSIVGDEINEWPMMYRGYDGVFEGIINQSLSDAIYQFNCEDGQGHHWHYIDPYQFKVTTSSEDLYLFGIGKDYEIYHKMGAHLEEIKGITGVRFTVWAPRAQRVSVVGEFNNYDGRRHVMHFIPSHGVWELFIPGLIEGDSYQYEIKTQEGKLLCKSDPYGNYFEVRPQHASRVFKDDHYKWKDKKWLALRKEKLVYKQPISIYEVHMGSWKKNQENESYTYREVAPELAAYVKKTGYTHVELMGIIEHPFDGSWGYQVTGYYAPTSRYGTPDDFKYMIDYLHQKGIGVILDWVPAHFPKDSFALEKFDGYPLYEKNDEKQANHPHWGTLIFDYSKPQVSNFLIGSALCWLEQYHIDGLRVDAVASMLYLDYGREGDYVPNQYGGKENLEAIAFLQHLNQVAYSRVPDIMMIAEESTAWPKVTYPVEEGGLGFGFKWNMGWMNDFLAYMKTPIAHREQAHGKITFSLMYAFSENFIQVLSHDEVVHEKGCMLDKMPGEQGGQYANLRVAYGFMFMHPGKKMLFMGNELAMNKEWDEKRELDWSLLDNPLHQGIWQFIKTLNRFYKREKALWEVNEGYNNFEWIDCENAKQHIVSFIRKGDLPEETLIIVINFGDETWEDFRVGVPYLAEYREVLNSDALAFGGEGITNKRKIIAQRIPWQEREQSICITIPKLTLSVLKVRKLLSLEMLQEMTLAPRRTIKKKLKSEKA